MANARSLKANGVPTDVIAKSLGLDAREIENLLTEESSDDDD